MSRLICVFFKAPLISRLDSSLIANLEDKVPCFVVSILLGFIFSYLLYDVVSANSYLVDLKLTVCLDANSSCQYSDSILSKAALPKQTVGFLPGGNQILTL